MKTASIPADDKIAEKAEATERGYSAWKRAKIERALEQAKHRDKLIPAEKIWRDLGLKG